MSDPFHQPDPACPLCKAGIPHTEYVYLPVEEHPEFPPMSQLRIRRTTARRLGLLGKGKLTYEDIQTVKADNHLAELNAVSRNK